MAQGRLEAIAVQAPSAQRIVIGPDKGFKLAVLLNCMLDLVRAGKAGIVI